MAESNRKVVLGLGNILNSDEGLGVHALQSLAQTLTSLNHEVEFVDGGVLGLNLLPLVESCSHLLILDAINAGLPPGSLLELRGEDIPLYAEARLSQHQITFQETLALAKLRAKLPPHLYLIGVQPADLSIRIGLSSVVALALPQVIERTVEVLRIWGLLET
ncbi:MAG: HyaD/HybD family hydrogenase maturation endopeptidase [Anaerolineae bacterium]